MRNRHLFPLEGDIFRQAHILARSREIELADDATSADCLHELEKRQLWLAQYNSTHPELEPTPGTMTAEELALLGLMRKKYPSIEDGVWAELYKGANVSVESLTEFSEADAEGIGRLMPFLSDRLSGDPMDEALLRDIIGSPHHEQLVARLDGVIVGAATMNMLMGPGAGREGYLEDFVTDPEVRGQGIGDKVWQAMLDWCEERGIDLGFTSHPSREAAHRFYLKHGAEIRKTTVFHVKVGEEV